MTLQPGKRVLVTAAASGIGLAIARAFTADGARVHICDINEEALSAVTRTEPSITSTVCDVSDLSSVERLVDAATVALGGSLISPNILNNQGLFFVEKVCTKPC